MAQRDWWALLVEGMVVGVPTELYFEFIYYDFLSSEVSLWMKSLLVIGLVPLGLFVAGVWYQLNLLEGDRRLSVRYKGWLMSWEGILVEDLAVLVSNGLLLSWIGALERMIYLLAVLVPLTLIRGILVVRLTRSA